jgi:hypothetical protein
LRAAMRWYYKIGAQVWPYELWNFLVADRRITHGPTLAEFLGSPREGEGEALTVLSNDMRMAGRPAVTPGSLVSIEFESLLALGPSEGAGDRRRAGDGDTRTACAPR